MRRFLPQIFVLSVIGSLFCYLSTLFAEWAALSPWTMGLVTLVWLGWVVWGNLRLRGGQIRGLFPWTLNIGMGVGMTFFLYVFLARVVSFFPWGDELVARSGAELVIALTLVTSVIGFFQATRGPHVQRVEIPLVDLPAAFDGLKIVQISDLHVSHTIGRDYVRRVVERTRELEPDLIAMTGDFADGHASDLREDIAPLGELSARFGKFFITGNHEYYWGVDEWVEEHRRLGARVLLNEHVVLSQGSDRLIVAGVTDIAAGALRPGHKSSVKQALQGAPEGVLKLLLAHQPASLHQARHEGVDLQLSGHTHGGQWFPAWIFVRLAQRYLRGLYRSGTAWIYVNRGTGYWGPPLRFLVSPELTLITLRRSKPA